MVINGEPTEGSGIEISPSLPRASASPPSLPTTTPPPADPAAEYLALLAAGHSPITALRGAWPPGDDDPHAYDSQALLRIARRDAEFAALETIYVEHSLRGHRPALARALLAHETLGSVQRLALERDTATHSRDRIDAANSLLDRHEATARVRPSADTEPSEGRLTLMELKRKVKELRSAEGQVLATETEESITETVVRSPSASQE